MPLFEIETQAHIVITWAEDEAAAEEVLAASYPNESSIRITQRTRDTWVISKAALGITDIVSPCSTARDCLARAAGDKDYAVRLYMQRTGSDLESSEQAIESNMAMGW